MEKQTTILESELKGEILFRTQLFITTPWARKFQNCTIDGMHVVGLLYDSLGAKEMFVSWYGDKIPALPAVFPILDNPRAVTMMLPIGSMIYETQIMTTDSIFITVNHDIEQLCIWCHHMFRGNPEQMCELDLTNDRIPKKEGDL